MPGWNAEQYLKFKEQRTWPAEDLAARAAKYNPKTVLDIGCGPGNSTFVLKQKLPGAELLGIDYSPDMIKRAQAEYPELSFRRQDGTRLEGCYDLLFSNACMQWLPEHSRLIPCWMEHLNRGGVLAVQIPMNEEEPLFQIIKETAAEEKWRLTAVKPQPDETLSPQEYFDILARCSSRFEAWETRYYHILPGHAALVEWVKGTRLRPYLEALGEKEGVEFEKEILRKAEQRYPVMKNGRVMLGFRRFFFIASQ